MWRDARNHASPNAGWPEAAMAGALDLRLAGPIRYDGVRHDKPWIGSGRSDADPLDLRWALAIYVQACPLLWLVGGIALGLVGGIAAVVLIEIAQPRVRSAAGVARATEVEVITELLPAPARGGWLPKRQEAA